MSSFLEMNALRDLRDRAPGAAFELAKTSVFAFLGGDMIIKIHFACVRLILSAKLPVILRGRGAGAGSSYNKRDSIAAYIVMVVVLRGCSFETEACRYTMVKHLTRKKERKIYDI